MKLKIALIDWSDASYFESLDINEHLYNVLRLGNTITVGFIVKETDDFVAIAGHYLPNLIDAHTFKCLQNVRPDLLYDQLRDVLTIPRSIINQMITITEIETEEVDKIEKLEIKK